MSATSLHRTLHWLSVKVRIQYKIACLCFQCHCHNTVTPHLSDLLQSYHPSSMLCFQCHCHNTVTPHLSDLLQSCHPSSMLCFQCHCHNTVTPHLSDLLQSYHPSRVLCFHDTSLLTVPRFCLDRLQEIFLCLWPYCLELCTFISQKNSVFSNIQKEPENSSF